MPFVMICNTCGAKAGNHADLNELCPCPRHPGWFTSAFQPQVEAQGNQKQYIVFCEKCQATHDTKEPCDRPTV